nr:ribonuclease H-like domain-containing protein [Tanacetum cinerariifolium]
GNIGIENIENNKPNFVLRTCGKSELKTQGLFPLRTCLYLGVFGVLGIKGIACGVEIGDLSVFVECWYYNLEYNFTNDPIPDVKGAFATLSRDESHKGSQIHNVVKTGNPAFVPRPNNRNNNWTFSNNQPRKLNRPNLVCTHCNMNGHAADKCFELVGYSPNFKKNIGFNKTCGSNSAVAGNKDQSSCNSFTDEQYKRLMDLISDKTRFRSMLANIAVGHPNGTKAVVTHVGSLRLTDKIVIHDVLVVPGYEDPSGDWSEKFVFIGYSNDKKGYKLFSLESKKVFYSRDVKFYVTVFPFKNNTECKEYEMVFEDKTSLNFLNYDENESKLSDPYDDRRDKESDEGEHPDDNEPAEAVSDLEENATLVESDKDSEDFSMLACKPCDTPIEAKEFGVKNKKDGSVEIDKPLTRINNYQKVLRYQKNSLGKGISFSKHNTMDLNVFVDSDWAKCKTTRKYVTGYVVFLGKDLVSWKSKKQTMLSKSSTEAKYREMNCVTCEVMWILKILNELNVKTSLPVPLHCDNSLAIQIAANPVFHERTKHFEIELFFLREKVASGVVRTVK